MFKSLRATDNKSLNHSGRSHVGETLQIEGDIKSPGSVDIAGLINGNVFVSDVIVTETGSVRGTLESSVIEINGHVEGKIKADSVIVGKSAVIKGDIFFKNTLKTEELTMLRRIVKGVHFQYFDKKHGKSFVTNKMLDNVIENIGPEAVEKMIKSGVDKGLR